MAFKYSMSTHWQLRRIKIKWELKVIGWVINMKLMGLRCSFSAENILICFDFSFAAFAYFSYQQREFISSFLYRRIIQFKSNSSWNRFWDLFLMENKLFHFFSLLTSLQNMTCDHPSILNSNVIHELIYKQVFDQTWIDCVWLKSFYRLRSQAHGNNPHKIKLMTIDPEYPDEP